MKMNKEASSRLQHPWLIANRTRHQLWVAPSPKTSRFSLETEIASVTLWEHAVRASLDSFITEKLYHAY